MHTINAPANYIILNAGIVIYMLNKTLRKHYSQNNHLRNRDVS